MEAEVLTRARESAQASRQLKEANAELARLYERTRELDRLKSEFFANVSHELRTPLTLILGPTQQLLASTDLGDAARGQLELIERNARVLVRHVEDLLDAARLEAGKVDVAYAEVDLAELVRRNASLFETVAGDRDVRYAIVATGPSPAQLDPDLHATPVIVLTAKADDVLRVRMLREGADDYVMKPFGVDELRARVANTLAGYLAAEALRHSEAAAHRTAAQLGGALHSRVVIEQAKGIIAAERGISVDEAFELLRKHARQRGAKLHAVADAVVSLGLRP